MQPSCQDGTGANYRFRMPNLGDARSAAASVPAAA